MAGIDVVVPTAFVRIAARGAAHVDQIIPTGRAQVAHVDLAEIDGAVARRGNAKLTRQGASSDRAQGVQELVAQVRGHVVQDEGVRGAARLRQPGGRGAANHVARADGANDVGRDRGGCHARRLDDGRHALDGIAPTAARNHVRGEHQCPAASRVRGEMLAEVLHGTLQSRGDRRVAPRRDRAQTLHDVADGGRQHADRHFRPCVVAGHAAVDLQLAHRRRLAAHVASHAARARLPEVHTARPTLRASARGRTAGARFGTVGVVGIAGTGGSRRHPRAIAQERSGTPVPAGPGAEPAIGVGRAGLVEDRERKHLQPHTQAGRSRIPDEAAQRVHDLLPA